MIMAESDSGPLPKPGHDFARQVGRSTPVRPLAEPTFIKSHLAISRGEYDQVHRTRNIRIITGKSDMRMREVIDATTEDFLYHLQRVGHKYGWDKRKQYQPENQPQLDKMMAKEGTRLYEFLINGKPAGFCLTTSIDNDDSKKIEIIDRFRQQRRLPANFNAIEINKFGLYDEFTGKGYGDYFLAKMLRILLERDKYGIVYLDTRDTNHKGVLNFYSDHGIDVFFAEELPNDQIDGVPPEHQPPTHTKTIEVNGSGNGGSGVGMPAIQDPPSNAGNGGTPPASHFG